MVINHQILKTLLLKSFRKYIYCILFLKSDLKIVSFRKNFSLLLKYLKKSIIFRFDSLQDISAVDYISKSNRFNLNYLSLSTTYNSRLILSIYFNSLNSVESISNLFKSAIWSEREVWDLFGIVFHNHPDLRRILTDYGFSGHPLRKDFPLTGFVEIFYDETEKHVKYFPVELTQEYRLFNFQNPW